MLNAKEDAETFEAKFKRTVLQINQDFNGLMSQFTLPSHMIDFCTVF